MKKKIKSKKTTLKLNSKVLSAVLPVALVFLGAAIVFINIVSPVPKGVNTEMNPTQAAVLVASPILPISPAPTATPTQVYKGYCLKVPVIYYHHIQPMAEARAKSQKSLTVDNGTFDSQMAYLSSKGYSAISAEQLGNALITKSGVPVKPVVITVDDGYSDFYTYAYPILQKYHLVASLAIPAGRLGNDGHMSWDQLKQLVGSGKIFAYSHTWSHANLTKVSAKKAQYEVLTAKVQLQQFLGKVSNVLFYPYGAVNNSAISVLSANGYRVGYTTEPGFVQCDSFLMSLHRTMIGNSSLASYGL